jgi:hypothetical protein
VITGAGDDVTTSTALSVWLDRPVELVQAGDTPGTFENPMDVDREADWISWQSQPGSFHDGRSTVSLVSAGSLADHEPERFRMNLILDGDGEDDLVGGEVTIGAARLRVRKAIDRCVMVARARPGITADLNVLKRVIRERDNLMGVGAVVLDAGSIAVGDADHARLSRSASSSAAGSCTEPDRRASTIRRSSSVRPTLTAPVPTAPGGSTVQPSPMCTICSSTSGWWLSAAMRTGAPSVRNVISTCRRVCELSGNSTHGPQPAGAPMRVPGGAITESGSARSGSVSTPAIGDGGSTHTARSSDPARNDSSSEPDGATVSTSCTSGRSDRNARTTAGWYTTAATSIMPRRTAPDRADRSRSAQATTSRVSATTCRA